MNRKLRNSLAGLATSASLLVLGLVVAHPGAQVSAASGAPLVTGVRNASAGDLEPAAHARLASAGAFASALPVAPAADRGAALSKDESPARPAKRRARAHRQTLVMPYFSLAPRG
ncbi:hypothetical protein ACFOED_02630 [Vulcaniibacterium thermophilum]|jgi:type IV secretory pathway TrbL component|uniref:Uncharacterized protein n=1 Tax=Vulcaniibacterium thermophilum TaxID=1169913 RepID=A0A918Z2G9_9GAMM|nr:hypothetical protein [Vulcaniibacterium thermophilum]GHE34563.1 hypothetical protein GCM10007167_15990 [Vulcaniibacterium thermophilum]